MYDPISIVGFSASGTKHPIEILKAPTLRDLHLYHGKMEARTHVFGRTGVGISASIKPWKSLVKRMRNRCSGALRDGSSEVLLKTMWLLWTNLLAFRCVHESYQTPWWSYTIVHTT